MSTFTTSRGTRGQHVRPKWSSRPYQQHPSRREHIYGKVKPMNETKYDIHAIIGGALLALLVVIFFAVRH